MAGAERGATTLLGAAACLLGLAALASCQVVSRRHTAGAEIDGDLYRGVRRADVLGLAPASALSSAPVRVGDLVRALPPAVEPPPGLERELTADEEWLDAFREEYAVEIEDAWAEGGAGSTTIQPAEPARLRLLFVDEPFHVYNEQGREFHQGLNMYLSNRVVARVWDRFLFTAEPELAFVENRNRADDEDVVLRFQELAASGRLGPIELTAGRMSLWWGPGRHGSLLLTNNARPFDLVRASTAGPQLLPGFLGYLGLVQAETFVTRLESSRAVSRPYLWGMRVSTRLNPYLELGASRVAQFGGEGRSVDLGTIWNVFTADTENDPNDPGNQIASVDSRIIVPWSVQPFELYGELGGEDEAGGFFSKEAFIAGLYLPRIGPWSWMELTLEFANTTVSGRTGVWYRNSNYPDGYTFHERIIGHHAGTDGLDAFGELRFHALEDVEVFLSFGYEEHLRRNPSFETLYETRVGVEARVWRGLSVVVAGGVDVWKNFRGEWRNDQVGHAFGGGLLWRF